MDGSNYNKKQGISIKSICRSLFEEESAMTIRGISRKGIMPVVTGVLMAGVVYSYLCLVCVANHNFVSEEEYARLSQEIVEQSLQP